MNKKNVDKVLKDTIEYANNEINKSKKKYIIMLLIIVVIICFLIMSYLFIFKYEIPVKYNKELINVEIPEDKGMYIKVNLDNYKETDAILVKIDDNSYDLYINVTQTLATKMFKDKDKTNNLLRIGNEMIIDFQSEKLQQYIPDGNNVDAIKHVYYIDNLSNKIKTMNDNELIKYKNKVLVWER